MKLKSKKGIMRQSMVKEIHAANRKYFRDLVRMRRDEWVYEY